MSEHRMCSAAQIEPGSTQRLEIDGLDILLCNVGGAFYAIEDVCTHDGGALDQGTLEGRCVICPRHGAMFDVETGAALTLPAVIPLQTFAVSVEGDAISVEL